MQEFKPFIHENQKVAELGFVPILVGIVLGIVFGASSLYLALKIGLTVSASIPIAVLSVTLFRECSRLFGTKPSTILQNNIVQTTGSAGESIAFGVAVTMPALLILGFEMEVSRILTVAVLGGVLGVLLMIPLRHTLIVAEHDKLPYPEGTACAAVLKAGEVGGSSAKMVFGGFFAGLFYKFINLGCNLFPETIARKLGFLKGSSVSADVAPELLGVGYIIGPRIAGVMMAGGVLSALVLTPMIIFFGSSAPAIFPGTQPIADMGSSDIRNAYILYIGAGAVVAGGLISLIQSLPMILRALAEALYSLIGQKITKENIRTQQDLPLSFVLIGILTLILAISLVPSMHMNIIGAVLIICFGLLFVTVSARLCGSIGSSSNPISGMTVATLLLTCLIFVFLGIQDQNLAVTALSVAAVVCVAASNGGTTSQDLKTGYLVGATPKAQQIGLLFGVVTSALVIGSILHILNEGSTIYSKLKLPSSTVEIKNLQEKGKAPGDTKEYFVYRQLKTENLIPEGKYLVDETGRFIYLVDPGINGHLTQRDDGTKVQKYDAPKARLMALIVDGIFSMKLPWSLILLGMFLALMMELAGIASLPFAVGLYLPMSVSTPVFIGGLLRWFVDSRKKSDSGEGSGGVLCSSGLIAGGAIAGILIALINLYPDILKSFDLSHLFKGGSGFFAPDMIALYFFAGLCLYLYRQAIK